MLYINGFVLKSSTNKMESIFVFELLAGNQKILKQIAMREYWSKFNVLFLNGLVSTSSTN